MVHVNNKLPIKYGLALKPKLIYFSESLGAPFVGVYDWTDCLSVCLYYFICELALALLIAHERCAACLVLHTQCAVYCRKK